LNGILTCKNRGLSLIALLSALVVVLFSGSNANAAITAAALTADAGSTTNDTSFTTASITPTANNLVLAWVTNTKGTTPDTPTLSGNGLTWVQVATVTWGTIAAPTARTTLFRAMGAAPSAGAVTISFGATNNQTGCAWSIIMFSGVVTSGTNGSDAVVQSLTNRIDASTALTITLAALGDAANASAGGFSNMKNQDTSITAGEGYTISAGASYNSPKTSIRSEWQTTGSTTVNVTSTSSDIGGIAVEVKAADLCPGNEVTTTADSGAGSLRECINTANVTPGTTISFNIEEAANQSSGGDSWWRISPNPTTLPSIAAAGTIIDATTQTANQGNTNTKGPEIEIYGAGAGAGVNGLTINNVGNVTIKGLAVNSFTSAGVLISGASATGNALYGNYIGTDALGGADLGNGGQGVSLTTSASSNNIGGPNAGEGNVISGNNTHGIHISTDCNNNRIRGNKIGTNYLGTVKIANTFNGIQIDGVPTSGTTVGGASAGEGNIISGNGAVGISVEGNGGANVYIYGNTIGTDATGTVTNIGNVTYGIAMNSTADTANIKVGGVNSGEGNLIAYNGSHGVYALSKVGNGAGNEIKGNTIRNNTGNGIYAGNISGPVIAMNLVRNNGGDSADDGIRIAAGATSAKVYHNTVHGNSGDGISVEKNGSTLMNNLITGNGAYGINLVAASMTESYNDVTDAATTPANISGSSNVALSATTINANPLYINAAGFNFSLTECTSPAINSGVDLGADQPDMNGGGAGNYNGSAPDMGTFEASACPSSGTPPIDHFRIDHGGNALTCQRADITVKACQNADCSVLISDSVEVTLSPTGWIGGDNQTITGGSTTFQLRHTTPGFVTLGVAGSTPAASGGDECFVGGSPASCDLEFFSTGFILDVPNLTSCQTSANVSISAVKASDSGEKCIADGGFASQSKTVNFWSGYVSPASGSKAVEINGTSIAGSSPGTGINLNFDGNAESLFTITYDDAGIVQLAALYLGSGEEAGLVMPGNDTFVVAPHHFEVTATTDGTAPLDNMTNSGSPLWKAGEDFHVKVKAVCADNSVTPNFAAVTELTAVAPFQPASGGSLAGGSIAAADFSGGMATDENVSYSEVGTATLQATCSNYLGSGIDITDTSATVGRFTPDHFDLALNTPSFTPGCSGSFTYMDQPFTYSTAPVITVTAKNLAGNTTQNYTGSWWKITDASLTGKAYSVASGTLDTSLVPGTDPVIGDSGSGVGTLSFSDGGGFAFTRSNPVANFDAEIALAINVIDTDGISYASNPANFGTATAGNGIGFIGGKSMRFGRLRMENAHGSELLALSVPLVAEYYTTGLAWVKNTNDSCSTLILDQFTLTSDYETVTANNNIMITAASSSTPSLSALSSGAGSLDFTAPTPAPASEGYIDISSDLTALYWLRFDWDGDGFHDNDPQGRATFGIYKGNEKMIFLRESVPN